LQLTGRNDHSVTLTITGYEFPNAEGLDEFDANWLVIRADVRNDDGNWRKSSACLLTSEVAALADWLDSPGGELDFIEPNLTFECIDRSADEARLIVWFELELRPDWANSGVAGQRDLSADLTVSRSELTQASRELRDQLAAFPSRAGAA
jgi:hypothetical protein